jgi:preprotein translocase subunit SecG
MATIYRFIVEARQATGVSYDADGNPIPAKGAGSKGGFSLTAHNPSGKNRGGVEHNRYMRPINPLMNQLTGGWWEKGQRLGRAGAGVLDVAKTKGVGSALTSTGMLIILQFAIMMAVEAFKDQQKKAKEENQANFLKIKSGQTTLGQDYKVSKNIFGLITYRNQ